MPRPVRWILTSLVVATLFAPSARAQNAAGGPPGMPGAVGVASGVASGGAVTCNDRFVFVLQDGVLYKFAVDSLRLIGSTPVGPKNVNEVGRVRAMAGEAQPGNDPVAIAEVVAVPAGGQMDFEQPVEAALAWLSAHQDEDGRWDADGFMKHDTEGAACDGPGAATHDVGVTGLACIALLAHGNTMRAGPHKDPLDRKSVV